MLVELFKYVLNLSYMAVIAFTVIMIVKLFIGRKFSARWNYAIWFLLIIRLMIPFSIPSPFSVFNLVPQKTYVAELNPAKTSESKYAKNNFINTNSINPLNNEEIVNNSKITVSNTSGSPDKFENVWEIVSYVWFAGFISIVAFFAWCYIRVWRRINKLVHKNEEILNDKLVLCIKKAGLKVKPKLLIVDDFNSPFVFAKYKPIIIVPACMIESLTDISKEHVLLHELMHIKRKDHRVNQLLVLFQAMHWFNPVIWNAFKKMKKDCELACDASVLKLISKNEHKEYANTLVEIAKEQCNFKFTYSVMAFGESNIKRRVKQIMKFKKSSIGAAFIATLIIAAVAVLVITSGNTKGISDTSMQDQEAAIIKHQEPVRTQNSVKPVKEVSDKPYSINIYHNDNNFDNLDDIKNIPPFKTINISKDDYEKNLSDILIENMKEVNQIKILNVWFEGKRIIADLDGIQKFDMGSYGSGILVNILVRTLLDIPGTAEAEIRINGKKGVEGNHFNFLCIYKKNPDGTITSYYDTKSPIESNEFRSKKLGISVIFPESWKGKYRVAEDETSIAVFFKPNSQIGDSKGRFFTILKKTEDSDERHYDDVQYFESNGTTYIIGKPTDVTYSEDDPEFDTFKRMQTEVSEVLKTLKSIR